jgi:hypothetical protein
MENNYSSFHYSVMDFFPQFKRLECPSDGSARIVLSLGANEPIFTDHVGHRNRNDCPLWKAVLRAPKLVTFVNYEAKVTYIFVDDLRLEISDLFIFFLTIKHFFLIEGEA